MPKEGLMSPQTAEVSPEEASKSPKEKQAPVTTGKSPAPAPEKK
jgi:hypothetical protein